MDKQIRNSTAEFLIFTSQNSELEETLVSSILEHTTNNKFLRSKISIFDILERLK